MAKYPRHGHMHTQGSLPRGKIERPGPASGKSLSVLRTVWHGACQSSLRLSASITSRSFLSQLIRHLYRLMDSLNSRAAQVKHFSRLLQYSILVFDHRGAGNSDTPKGPYSSVLLSSDPFDRG
ncbi:hypothetical protein EDB84DRAFT_341065 [Lactarius hengduanensis]|nr:hypothetical protein EDB84DRAFT_341065 [Lactarius hengduanensis]